MFFLPALFLTALAILCVLVPLSEKGRSPPSRRRAAATAALFFIPLFSLALYSQTGHPGLPDMPLKLRRAASLDDADFTTLISRLEERLKKDGKDAQGWTLLARSYRTLGRLDEAANAYREILKLKGDDIPALSSLAEVLSEKEGRVAPEAKAIFQKILSKDGKNPEARFFLARAKIESGDRQGGLRDLKALLADTPQDAPWRAPVMEEIGKHE